MMKSTFLSAGPVALLALALAMPARAQVTTAPTLGPAPVLTLPAVQSSVLPNGLRIMVSRNAEVPIVQAELVIDGGQRLTGATRGIAGFTARMLAEGAGKRDALHIAEEVAFLGASIGASADWESVTISLRTPKRNIDPALALMSDLLLRPTFAAVDVRRARDLALASLIAARDQPGTVANSVFYRNVYPASHPYHADASADSAAVASLDSTRVRAFWTRAIDPRHATLVLTGDVTLAEATTWATRHFASWKPPVNPLTKPLAAAIAAPARAVTRVILVDKPDAAQSVIIVGSAGVSRKSADYPALTLMNTVLGGSFSSRLNDILREQLGYSYGAGSGFDWEPVPGPFTASSQVRTNVTDSSLAVIFREIKRMRDEPLPAVELERGKNYLVLGALGNYETAGAVAGAITTSLAFGMPLGATTAEYVRINGVTAADVQRVARTYLDPAHLTVVIVGDLAKIRAGIEKLNLGPVQVQLF